MANDTNHIELSGRLTRDPEMRYTQLGNPICTFGMASNRSYKPQNSEEWSKDTLFISVVVFGEEAEHLGNELRKGHPVNVEGRLQLRQWEAADGQKRQAYEVVANSVAAIERNQQ